jgi:hypothetical protein
MSDTGAPSRRDDLWRWLGVGLRAVGYPMFAVMGPAVILGAVVGYSPAWTPASRWLIGAFGVFLTIVTGFIVIFGLRTDLFGRPRATISEDGIRIARGEAGWDELGSVEIVMNRAALAVEVPPSMLREMTRSDRFLASLNPTAANGMTILYLTARQLQTPIDQAFGRVPPNHRRS